MPFIRISHSDGRGEYGRVLDVRRAGDGEAEEYCVVTSGGMDGWWDDFEVLQTVVARCEAVRRGHFHPSYAALNALAERIEAATTIQRHVRAVKSQPASPPPALSVSTPSPQPVLTDVPTPPPLRPLEAGFGEELPPLQGLTLAELSPGHSAAERDEKMQTGPAYPPLPPANLDTRGRDAQRVVFRNVPSPVPSSRPSATTVSRPTIAPFARPSTFNDSRGAVFAPDDAPGTAEERYNPLLGALLRRTRGRRWVYGRVVEVVRDQRRGIDKYLVRWSGADAGKEELLAEYDVLRRLVRRSVMPGQPKKLPRAALCPDYQDLDALAEQVEAAVKIQRCTRTRHRPPPPPPPRPARPRPIIPHSKTSISALPSFELLPNVNAGDETPTTTGHIRVTSRRPKLRPEDERERKEAQRERPDILPTILTQQLASEMTNLKQTLLSTQTSAELHEMERHILSRLDRLEAAQLEEKQKHTDPSYRLQQLSRSEDEKYHQMQLELSQLRDTIQGQHRELMEQQRRQEKREEEERRRRQDDEARWRAERLHDKMREIRDLLRTRGAADERPIRGQETPVAAPPPPSPPPITQVILPQTPPAPSPPPPPPYPIHVPFPYPAFGNPPTAPKDDRRKSPPRRRHEDSAGEEKLRPTAPQVTQVILPSSAAPTAPHDVAKEMASALAAQAPQIVSYNITLPAPPYRGTHKPPLQPRQRHHQQQTTAAETPPPPLLSSPSPSEHEHFEDGITVRTTLQSPTYYPAPMPSTYLPPTTRHQPPFRFPIPYSTPLTFAQPAARTDQRACVMVRPSAKQHATVSAGEVAEELIGGLPGLMQVERLPDLKTAVVSHLPTVVAPEEEREQGDRQLPMEQMETQPLQPSTRRYEAVVHQIETEEETQLAEPEEPCGLLENHKSPQTRPATLPQASQLSPEPSPAKPAAPKMRLPPPRGKYLGPQLAAAKAAKMGKMASPPQPAKIPSPPSQVQPPVTIVDTSDESSSEEEDTGIFANLMGMFGGGSGGRTEGK
ncbi:unnamed protein product [Vitrella brassicaformis CCMP3155]|uniref:Uncharacterized protein n=3 Tax=Vitrella brassicaformis TaxID=1169539 RepID=A0A0G4FFJ1_VITBC|nr:unnamed protein product [Vitrella brassicaformis CCMP3155]|eukprot:CEM11638.1 unnamed protein product [Vitrella brassicaformis CCMP3155]